MQIPRVSRTLKPKEEHIKDFLEYLLKLEVNLRFATVQKRIVANIIVSLKSKRLTYVKFFDMLLYLLQNVKQKESMAILANIFKMAIATAKLQELETRYENMRNEQARERTEIEMEKQQKIIDDLKI